MTKKLVIESEVYEYPDQGDVNYGEEATNWAEAVTDVLATVRGPGDISTTEVNLTGTLVGDRKEGNITNLKFDTAFVQDIKVEGFITRTYTDLTPTKVEHFDLQGAYNGTDFNFSVDFSGDDTDFEFGVVGGQFTFSYLDTANTDIVKIKFSAKAKIDETYFE